MLKRIAVIGGILAAVFVFSLAYLHLTPMNKYWNIRVYAQTVFELTCPVGTTSVQALQTIDTITGKSRQNYCVDIAGNVFESGAGSPSTSVHINFGATTDAGATINSFVSNVLPTCNPYPSYNYGNSTVPFSAKCGNIIADTNAPSPAGGYLINTPVVIASSMVRIIGSEKISTQFQCSSAVSPCIQFLMGNSAGAGHGGGTVTAGPSPVMSVRGGMENISITGSSTANQIGVQCNDCTGAVLKDLRISNFSGTNAIGIYLLNDLDGITERLEMDNIAFEGNTNGLVLDAPNVSLLSFNHESWMHLQFTIGNGQTAEVFKNFAQWSGFEEGVVNVCLGGQSCTGISILNSASLKGEVGLLFDGAGTITLCSGCTSSNAQFWGASAGPTQAYTNSGTFSIKDTQIPFNCTTAGVGCGIPFFVGGTEKGNISVTSGGDIVFLSGGNSAVATILTTSAGGGFFLNGSASGSAAIIPNSTGTTMNLSLTGGSSLPLPQIIATSFTTTAAASDNVTVTGMTTTGHCYLTATNSGAAGGIASVFISAKAANQITVSHTATAGWTFDVVCSPQ